MKVKHSSSGSSCNCEFTLSPENTEKKKKRKTGSSLHVCNWYVLCVFMREVLFCFTGLTVDIMVWYLPEVDLNQVLLSSNPRHKHHSWLLKWAVAMLFAKHMCKADPTVGHQNRRVNTQLALSPVLLLLWLCVKPPLRKTHLGKHWSEWFFVFVFLAVIFYIMTQPLLYSCDEWDEGGQKNKDVVLALKMGLFNTPYQSATGFKTQVYLTQAINFGAFPLFLLVVMTVGILLATTMSHQIIREIIRV